MSLQDNSEGRVSGPGDKGSKFAKGLKKAVANKMQKKHMHSYSANDVIKDYSGKGGYSCTTCGAKK